MPANRRLGAHTRSTARKESSKPTAAYLWARAPAEAASARAPASRLHVQFMRPGLPHAVVSDRELRDGVRRPVRKTCSARASIDLAWLRRRQHSSIARARDIETMRTHLFAALVGLCANGAAAQDDNAITDMISNPILCVSAAHESSFMRFTTPSKRLLLLLDGARYRSSAERPSTPPRRAPGATVVA